MGGNPQSVITDGLFQYDAAIKKVMHWRLHERRRKHIKDSGVCKNSPVELVNLEVKRRIKWFSSFQCFAGAVAFFRCSSSILMSEQLMPVKTRVS
ncbi:hypothetical protein GF327_00365 [Candidatus Woesearchaeota archaeon]|nr:hypothetical protein [Candidatus Woesearchaeota archaeon]